jgi:hypothetical protein
LWQRRPVSAGRCWPANTAYRRADGRRHRLTTRAAALH